MSPRNSTGAVASDPLKTATLCGWVSWFAKWIVMVPPGGPEAVSFVLENARFFAERSMAPGPPGPPPCGPPPPAAVMVPVIVGCTSQWKK